MAGRIDARIRSLPEQTVPSVRPIRREASAELRGADGEFVLEVARALHHVYGQRWVALELIRRHEGALGLISEDHLEEFSRGLDGWGSVDAFAGLLAGAAWLRGRVPDRIFHEWAGSPNRWLRRAALASTVVLNTPSHGGGGDAPRTLAVCELLVADREEMVVNALSWALRKLVAHDRAAVRRFLAEHDGVLAPRVKREVRNKLGTGLKNPGRKRAACPNGARGGGRGRSRSRHRLRKGGKSC